MDHHQILQSRANRSTRLARPFQNFHETFDQCVKAGEAILAGDFSPEFTPLMERSVVISAVTAIEIYYRDILDSVFKYCAPDYFEPTLKQLHPEKYDITDIVEMYRHGIHPLELVASSQSFQNVDKIERVFSKFLRSGLWDSVYKLQVRLREKPANIVIWSKDDYHGLKQTFELRHELVHDPARRSFLTESVIEDLEKAAHMLFGSDVVITQAMVANRDPALGYDADA